VGLNDQQLTTKLCTNISQKKATLHHKRKSQKKATLHHKRKERGGKTETLHGKKLFPLRKHDYKKPVIVQCRWNPVTVGSRAQ